MKTFLLIRTILFLLLSLSFFTSPIAYAQKSSEEIYKDIKKLGVLANVLYVAAHPDDENPRLISFLSNHVYANTTYLSMTRGDGGQNLIGHEFREMLGIIRSHELLEARKIDGGHQLFTRANDFGFSKTPAETFATWDKEKVLSDVVWAIRTTKPDVIINRFSTDTSRPNHGHHTASAILSVEAFDLAADPKAFPEQLKFTQPWQPHRQFMNTTWWFYGSREAFDKADKSKMLAVDIGAFDPLSGESNTEIAARSRSMHKSQAFGAAETRGESFDYLDLIKDVDQKIPTSLFDGIDITWNRVAGGKSIGIKVNQLDAGFDFRAPGKSIPILLEIYQDIQNLPSSFWKTIKLRECEELIKSCLGLFIEVRANKYNVTPGSSLPVTLEIINRSDATVSLSSIIPLGMNTTLNAEMVLVNNKVATKEFYYTVPDQLSIPYWLESTPSNGMYIVDNQQMRGKPADDPKMNVQIRIMVNNQPFTFVTPVVYKTVDPAIGEVTKPLSVVPPVTIHISEEAIVFNYKEPRVIPVTLTAYKDSVSGTLELSIADKNWEIAPQSIPFTFNRTGESQQFYCTVTPPAFGSGTELVPKVKTDDGQWKWKIEVIDYDHLPYMSIVRDAATSLQSLDIRITHRSIGYIEGAGDDVAASLRQIGYKVDILEPSTLSPDMLSKYQVIILGVRAYNTIDALSHKNSVLFDWVKQGGTMIVQYNTNRDLVTENIAPFPLSISRDRVTEENAPVTLLEPNHPALQFPNVIVPADFDGWTQERGLYFAGTWDEHFIPLLEMHDTNETGMKGGLLVAPYGEGYYVYSGLSWFRHLPSGNPGPYRLLSNIISLGFKNSKS